MEKLNRISIELIVSAVKMEQRVWMQGDLEITINGEKPYSESDIVDAAVLLESLESDGEYFIFSCICGVPECGGWATGIKVTHKGNIIEWIDSNNDKTWYLEKNEIESHLKSIRKEVKFFKQYFKKKGIDYVGVGYSW
jgi:hypothetical protein